MTLTVIDDYVIETDSTNNCYEVRLLTGMKTDAKTGEEKQTYKTIGYYGTIANAMKSLYKNRCIKIADEKGKDTGSITIKEYLDIIESCNKELNNSLSVFKDY